MPASLRETPRSQLNATKVSDILAERIRLGEKSLSFEFYPPRDEAAEANLWKTFDAICEIDADFVSVTYGAGGSNQQRTLAVTEQMAPKLTTVGHLTCVGSTRSESQSIIESFMEHGVNSILALRGDAPKDNPDALAKGELKQALELVKIASEYSNLEVGVAAFPEKHPESSSLQHDAEVLKLKQAAGSQFAITQLFFTVDSYLDLLAANQKAGVTIPVIPGVMPISNAKQVLRIAEMSNASVPKNLLAALHDADEVEARSIGMKFSIELAEKLLAAEAPGIHIFTLNQKAAALELASSVGLVR